MVPHSCENKAISAPSWAWAWAWAELGNKLEKDLDVELTIRKAYCIKREGRFPDKNFEEISPEIIKTGHTDTLVMETGNIEITNIDVNQAIMSSDKNIEESKKNWFAAVEENSKSLFQIAEDCVSRDENLHVVIVKRPERFDKSSEDIIGIKPKLSEYGNKVYEQCLLKSNHSGRIHVVDLNLGAQKSKHLKDIIYGRQDNPIYDGIHLSGSEAGRHFTYRAVQALRPILSNTSQANLFSSQARQGSRGISAGVESSDRHTEFKDHTNCPQARYQREQFIKKRGNRAAEQPHYVSYADAMRNDGRTTRVGQKFTFSIPTRNRFDQLPRNSQGNY